MSETRAEPDHLSRVQYYNYFYCAAIYSTHLSTSRGDVVLLVLVSSLRDSKAPLSFMFVFGGLCELSSAPKVLSKVSRKPAPVTSLSSVPSPLNVGLSPPRIKVDVRVYSKWSTHGLELCKR